MEYDWSKLPQEEHGTIIAHVEADNWSEVSKLCDKYEVSKLCCCNPKGLKNYTHWAIEKGIIRNEAMATAASGDGGTII